MGRDDLKILFGYFAVANFFCLAEQVVSREYLAVVCRESQRSNFRQGDDKAEVFRRFRFLPYRAARVIW